MSRFPLPDGKVRVVPSLLAADFGDLAGAVVTAEHAGADWISVDVMDGHFVPNLSFGPDHVKALRSRTQAALDTHLMVTDPRRMLPLFADAGADVVIAHVEACDKPGEVVQEIARKGKAAGLAIKPATTVDAMLPFLQDIQVALVMTVEPGFGGQKFMRDMMPKVKALREAVDRKGLKTWVMVDGGVDLETASVAAEAGADAMVAGTSFYRAKDPAQAYREIARRAQDAFGHRRN